MNNEEENRDKNTNSTQSPDHVNGRFVEGNSQRIGHCPGKDPAELGRKGDGAKKARIKRLTTYLRKHLDALVKDNPDLEKFKDKHGDKTVGSLLMHRILEESNKDPIKAAPLVRDILNRIDGVLTPDIEVDPDTPVNIVKFVVVEKRVAEKEETEE